MTRSALFFTAVLLLFPLASVTAGESPQEARGKLMEGVGKAAKPLGQMMKGEIDFDAARVMQSLETWRDAAARFGDLFPKGSESGYDTEARDTIWSDRAGFDQVLADWGAAVDAAIAANPQSLDNLKPVAGPVFKQCKTCHEGYRVEDD